jgi:hypothetical protein
MAKCDHCGRETDNEPRPDPFLLEIEYVTDIVVLCDVCYETRLDDIP